MNTIKTLSTQTKKKKGGFTLIEVIAVLILLGILAAVAIPKYVDLTVQAKQRALDAGISELNGREALQWGQAMLATSGSPVDTAIYLLVIGDSLGSSYSATTFAANAGAAAAAGATTLDFQGENITLTRALGTDLTPGIWTSP